MKQDKPFVRRMYQKQELALLYFPHLRPHAATNRLLRWINQCGQLHSELQLTGARGLRNPQDAKIK